MAGEVVTIVCPEAEDTLVGQVKNLLHARNRKWKASLQCLMLPMDMDDCQDEQEAPQQLDDECPLSSYGINDGDRIEMLVKDIEWSESDRELHRMIETGGESVDLSMKNLDDNAASAIAWAIENEVTLMRHLIHQRRFLILPFTNSSFDECHIVSKSEFLVSADQPGNPLVQLVAI